MTDDASPEEDSTDKEEKEGEAGVDEDKKDGQKEEENGKKNSLVHNFTF